MVSARYCKQHLAEWYSFAIGIKSDQYCHRSFPFNKMTLFDLILYVPSTIFQLNRDGSSWVEPVLSYDKCVLLKDHNAVTPVRLEPAASQSRVKHSTTEPLRSLNKMTKFVRVHVSCFYWSRATRQILFTCVKVTKTFKILNLRN